MPLYMKIACQLLNIFKKYLKIHGKSSVYTCKFIYNILHVLIFEKYFICKMQDIVAKCE